MGDTTVEKDSDCDVDHGVGDVEDTARSATKCLRRFIGRPATPASWPPDEVGFFQPRVVQGWGQVHNRRGSNRCWMIHQWQVSGIWGSGSRDLTVNSGQKSKDHRGAEARLQIGHDRLDLGRVGVVDPRNSEIVYPIRARNFDVVNGMSAHTWKLINPKMSSDPKLTGEVQAHERANWAIAAHVKKLVAAKRASSGRAALTALNLTTNSLSKQDANSGSLSVRAAWQPKGQSAAAADGRHKHGVEVGIGERGRSSASEGQGRRNCCRRRASCSNMRPCSHARMSSS
jgi:hypothetical protein